uniref:Uncharacterized protein n=1 Tax=Nelumbo nucifera TaxID=4432 RepID=A0A822ZIG7_NELNU|nr:TPA_asm: hypothetical protein HUJ06_002664 [Nelumbo nucifera]
MIKRKLTAFQRLNFTADDVLECLSMSDKIIRMGSTGTLYKREGGGRALKNPIEAWSRHRLHHQQNTREQIKT